MISLKDYFAKGPVKSSDSLLPFVENAYACRSRVRKLRNKQFLNCLKAQVVGRGMEAKILIDNLPLFEELEAEIKTLENRANDIDKMLEELDGIISKAGDISIRRPTPDGLRSGVGERQKLVWEIESRLRREAGERLAVGDVAGLPTAEPGNLAEVMKKEIDETNDKIRELEAEIELLTNLHKECQKIMLESRDLLTPAEEPEVVEEPEIPPYAMPSPNAPIEPRAAVLHYLSVNI